MHTQTDGLKYDATGPICRMGGGITKTSVSEMAVYSMYNLTSGDNTRSLRKIVFCEFASIAMSRL